jgi:hypothetical protein
MDARRSLLPLFFLIVMAAGVVARAGASTLTYDLTGNPAELHTITPTDDPIVQQIFSLTDADNGSNVLPGGVLSVGDTINVNVTLNGALTVPAGSGSQTTQAWVDLVGMSPDVGGSFSASLQYYNNGVQVTPPSEFESVVTGGPILRVGLISVGPTPSFSFDKVVDSITVDSLNQSGESISQTPLTMAAPEFTIAYPAPVPLPAAFWLLLSGLGGLRALTRNTPTPAASSSTT